MESNQLGFKSESIFDRQERIQWWDQKLLSKARIMVVGAGAIGNEVLKNLALLGVGNVLVIDFDVIETSNLSRTVLFRKEDIGKQKAQVAAQRTKELALAEDFTIDWFHGDVIWELGLGFYQDVDLVLSCLDNVETRFAVNQACWLTETPWIDSGIKELNGHVMTYIPPDGPCYACHSSEQLALERKNRYSCFNLKRKMVAEGKVATVQIAAARVASIQVQEAVKVLHKNVTQVSCRLHFQGYLNEFERIIVPENKGCFIHSLSKIEDVVPLPLDNTTSLKKLLEMLEEEFQLEFASLDISDEIWSFIESIGDQENLKYIRKPNFKVFEEEVISSDYSDFIKQEISSFNLTDSKHYLDFTLKELGVPCGHIISIKDEKDNIHYFLLQKDIEKGNS